MYIKITNKVIWHESAHLQSGSQIYFSVEKNKQKKHYLNFK